MLQENHGGVIDVAYGDQDGDPHRAVRGIELVSRDLGVREQAEGEELVCRDLGVRDRKRQTMVRRGVGP
jgi:hypothetical protein